MFRHPGEIFRGPQGDPHPIDILVPVTDDGKCGWPLQARLPNPPQGNLGGTPVTNNFNVVVVAVICHWVTVVGDPKVGAGHEGLLTTIQSLSALFYAYEGFIVLTESARLQRVFYALISLFDRVGKHTNKRKTVTMVCCPCNTSHSCSTKAYTGRMIEMGISF